MNISPAVKKETVHIALGVLLLSVVECIVFAAVGQWSLSVLWGVLLGGGWAVLSFFLMGLTVQKAAACTDERRRGSMIQLSYSLRMLALLGVCTIGLTVAAVHWLPVLLAQIFPRFTILFLNVLYKQDTKKQPAAGAEQPAVPEAADKPQEAVHAAAPPQPYTAAAARKGTRAILEEILHEDEEGED